jgi:periplasmic protein TonB
MLYQNKVKHNVIIKTSLYLLIVMTGMLSLNACKTGKNADEQQKDSLTADSVAKAEAAAKAATTNKTTTVIITGKAVANPAKKNGRWEVIVERDRKWEDEYANMMLEKDRLGIYYRTEIKPSYPGGEKALAKFIQENIIYPEAAIENGVEGEVMVGFAVDERGVIYTPIIKGDLAGYGLDEAATTVVAKMPLWNPGQIQGRNVKSYFSLPIKFRIY